MDKNTVKIIKNKLLLSDYISKYLELNESNKGVCPFHKESDPSLSVSDDKGIWKCFGCGKTGDIFTFSMEYHRQSFGQSLKELADLAHVPLEKSKSEYYRFFQEINDVFISHNAHEIFNDYMIKKRQIPLDIIYEYGLGYIPKMFKVPEEYKDIVTEVGLMSDKYPGWFRLNNSVSFPFEGIGFTFNNILGYPKYMHQSNSRYFKKGDHLLGLDKAKKYISDSLVIVEGHFDLLRCFSVGYRDVVAICGTSVTIEQLSVIKRLRLKNIYIAFDGDSSGRKAAIKLYGQLKSINIPAVYIVDMDSDPDDYLLKYGEFGGTYGITAFFRKYFNDNDLDLLLSSISNIRELSVLNSYIDEINQWYSNIPIDLIKTRLNQVPQISNETKINIETNENLVQLIRGWSFGLIPLYKETLNSDLRLVKVYLELKRNKDKYGYIKVDELAFNPGQYMVPPVFTKKQLAQLVLALTPLDALSLEDIKELKKC